MVAEFATDPIEHKLRLDKRGPGGSSKPGNGRAACKLGQRAVVIGAGIGGLTAAGALAQHFERVDILERDRLATSVASGSGTPQDRHPHGLLAGGLQALDQIFPGFKNDLSAAGAVPVSFAREVQFERPDVGVLPKRDFGISVLCATRPLIELVLRRRTEAVSNITLRPASRVIGMVPMAGRAGASGVQFVNGSERSETLDADLVVDASGRAAPTLALLDAFCWDRPQTTEIGVDITYATAVVEIPPDATAGWKIVLTLPDPPYLALHAVLVPTEDNHWIVAIADHGATARIETWDAFLDASRSLLTPTVYNALRFAQPPEGIRHYRFRVSTWRHFERLPRLPRGVLPVADSFCRFNPIHGQGMSSAAKQARLLQDVLHRAADEPDPIAHVQAGFMVEAASVLETPWIMSTSADLAFPRRAGNGRTILRNRESSRLPSSVPLSPIRSFIARRWKSPICCSLISGYGNQTSCDGSRRVRSFRPPPDRSVNAHRQSLLAQ